MNKLVNQNKLNKRNKHNKQTNNKLNEHNKQIKLNKLNTMYSFGGAGYSAFFPRIVFFIMISLFILLI